jgi:hypothetical protein
MTAAALITPLEVVMAIVGSTLAIGSYTFVFFGDHYLYSINENLYLGGGVVYSIWAIYTQLKGSLVDNLAQGHWTVIIPFIIGLSVLTRLTKFRWAARYSVSVLSGIGIGVVFGLTIRTGILVPVRATAESLLNLSPDPLSALIIFVGTLLSFTYFLYSRKYATPFWTGRLGFMSKWGRYFLYASFGYLFGKIYINESLDSVANFWMNYVYRTVVAIQQFLGGG